MLKRFLKDSVVYSASTLLSRGITILLIPLYTRYLQPEEYGAFDLLTVMATIINYVVALEISQGVARSYSDARTAESKQECVSSALWFAVCAYLTFIIIAFPFSPIIANFLLDSTKWQKSVEALFIAILANGIFFILQDLLRWQLKPLRHAFVSFVYTVVSSLVAVTFVVCFSSGIKGIIYGQCAGAVIGIIVAWGNGAAKYWRLIFSLRKWFEMVSYSAPQVLSSIASYFALYVDRLLIKELMTLNDVGVYGIGARFGSLVLLVMTGFQSALVPIVFKKHSEPGMPSQLARVFSYFLVSAISAILFLCTFSKEIVFLFTTPEYYRSWSIIPIIATAVLLSNMYIFILGIYIARQTKIVLWITLASACINVASNFVLIPTYGLIGAASATLLSALFGFLCYLYYNQRFYPIPFVWQRIIKTTIFGIVVAILMTGLQIGNYTGTYAIVTKMSVLVISAILVVVIGLGRDEIQLLINRIRMKSDYFKQSKKRF
jgi:O-antigen/teichoic acid export membrane protein